MRTRRTRSLSPDLRRTAWRIGLQTAGLLMACLVVVGTVLYVAVVRSQDGQLDQTLRTAAANAHAGRPDGDRDDDDHQPRGGVKLAVLGPDGVLKVDTLPPGLLDEDVMRQVQGSGVDVQQVVHLPTGAYEVLTTRHGGDAVRVAASRFEEHQERERILGALGVAGGTGLVLATLAAAVLARRAVRPMAEALEQQRRFVADAGHELRTPLTLLSTRAQLLARRVRDQTTPAAQRAELVERDASGLVADTAVLVAVLEDLLTAADTRSDVPEEPVDLTAVASSTVEAAQVTAQQNGVTLTVASPPVGSAVVTGASTALARAVAALVDNALDHARALVEVRVARTGRDVVVEVLDDGPGIPSATLPRMFERFSSDRRDVSDPHGRRHFGLGLALVSEIATRHGGTVVAENRPSPRTGAVLRLVLPAAGAGRGPARVRDAGPAGLPSAGPDDVAARVGTSSREHR